MLNMISTVFAVKWVFFYFFKELGYELRRDSETSSE